MSLKLFNTSVYHFKTQRLASILFCLVFFTAFTGLAQLRNTAIGTPPITNFDRSEYAAGTQNWCIKQDEKGTIHIGNNKGLLRFDGSYWRTTQLPNYTIVRSVEFGPNNRVYLGGQNEIGYLEVGNSGREEYHSLTSLIPDGNRDFEDVWEIFLIDGNVLFCSEKAVFVIENDECSVIEPIGKRFENYFQVADRVFFQDKEAGLYEWSGNELLKIDGDGKFKNERIASILPYSENKLLIATVSQGFFFLENTKVETWDIDANEFAKSYQPYCGIQLRNKLYAIGTAQNGFFILNRKGEITQQLDSRKGLQNNTVLSIFEDRQNNLWLGLDNGIDYVEISSSFRMIKGELGVEGTGYASKIFDGKLYIGTNQGLYVKSWKLQGSETGNTNFKRLENTKGQVWALNEIEQKLYIGRHAGADVITSDRLNHFSDIEGAWKFMELSKYPGYVLEGTYAGFYLHRKDKSSPTGLEFVGKLDGFEESSRIFEEDAEGNIWVSHAYRGLYKIELTGTVPQINRIVSFESGRGLPANLYINVSKIRNELVFSTPSGAYTYSVPKDSFIVHEDLTDILGENRHIERLIEDELGNIWFSVDDNFGVIKVKEKGMYNELEIFNFNRLQDALIDGFEHIYAYDSENIFIATEEGFVHYNPTVKDDAKFPFPLYVKRVQLTGQTDSLLMDNGVAVSGNKEELKANMNNLKFVHVTPNFQQLNRIEYRYKLNGFDSDWSRWSTHPEKEYTNLPYGKYTYTVQARNAYGSISNDANYSFVIHPPWYASVYARMAYILLFIIGFFSLFSWIRRREKKKTEAFKQAQNEKLRKKEAEFKETVEKSEKEIFSLRNEKLQNEISHKNSELASATMHLVQKGEILMKIKADLNNLEKDVPEKLKQKVKQIERVIESDVRLDKNWERFESHFDQVHENFFKRLRSNYPELTPKDQKLCAYLRMNLTTKEIAPLLNISVRGVEISRYRLRKKMELDSDVNLVSFILEL
ncbi:MAG: two-component regulator propeller domain-containing protein [Cryomorphaceae bacterium]|nr:LuxR C-terminal-related transcriptional regulator [Flavobacteriales bacterium]